MMDRLIVEIESFLPRDVAAKLTSCHGKEIRWLLSSYAKLKVDPGGKTPDDLLFDSKVVLDRTWEMLNVGKWIDVPAHVREVYSIATLIQVIALLRVGGEDSVRKSLEVADLGILLGLPFHEIDLTKVAEILSAHVSSVAENRRDASPKAAGPSRPEDRASSPKKMKLANEVDCCSRPSLEFFRDHFFRARKPAKLTDCIGHWPALELWNDLNYIKSKAGFRTVPIEIGKHYVDASYRQKLMKIADFIDEFFDPEAADVGYLAQHQLFDQVPVLKKDIAVPDYCAVSEDDADEESSDVDVNAWFGPKGTVSPLHFDPKHNLLCQVVGRKKIVLYPESDSEFLYPYEGMHKNTSRVDVEDPDFETFPDFRKAIRRECLLNPGDVLYIPPKYWHHVRALDNSFSVSFWWQ